MNALAVSPPRNQISPEHGPELTGPLKCWLLEEPSDAKAIDVISKSPILLRQAEDIAPLLRQEARRPATIDQIKAIVGSRFALFPQPERSAGEWDMWWADYLSTLEGLTPAAIEAGMAAWVRSIDAEFMPKPGKLRELATTTPATSKWTRAAERIRKAIPVEPMVALPAPEAPRPSKEDMAAQMEAFLKTMADKDPFAKIRAKASRPTPTARLMEGRAMSAEMQALMERG